MTSLSPRIVTLSFEGNEEAKSVTVEKSESRSGLLFTVKLPQLVSAESANLAVALIYEQELPARPERIKMNNLRFENRGAIEGLTEFLSHYSSGVVQLSLKDLHSKEQSGSERDCFLTLIGAFLSQANRLEVLNLSQNILPPDLWRHFAPCRSLRKLLMDHVTMAQTSLHQFTQHCPSSALEDFYLVLTNPKDGPESAALTLDVSQFLAKCTNLLSLRWAHLEAAGTLPWPGLRLLSNQSFRLRHLVMDGSTISVSELGNDGLCGALRQLLQLKTLKLRDVGLHDTGVKAVISALKSARPPLEWLELSGNQIEDASCVAQLAQVDKIASSLEVVSLERNAIPINHARTIVNAFGPIEQVEVRLDENPIDFTQMALEIARDNKSSNGSNNITKDSEKDRKLLEYEHLIRTLTAEKNTLTEEVRKLFSECKKLRSERETMMEAFSIIGATRQIDEHRRLADRVQRLEDAVGLKQPHRNSSSSSGSGAPLRSRSLNYGRQVLETPVSQTVHVDIPTPSSRGSVTSTGSGGRLRSNSSLRGVDDNQTVATSRSAPVYARRMSPLPSGSPTSGKAPSLARGVYRHNSSDSGSAGGGGSVNNNSSGNTRDPSEGSSTSTNRPQVGRGMSVRSSALGNDLESLPDIETPNGKPRPILRNMGSKLPASIDLEKHGSSDKDEDRRLSGMIYNGVTKTLGRQNSNKMRKGQSERYLNRASAPFVFDDQSEHSEDESTYDVKSFHH